MSPHLLRTLSIGDPTDNRSRVARARYAKTRASTGGKRGSARRDNARSRCAVCREPVRHADRVIAIHGLTVHIRCAVYRRGSTRL